MNVLILGGGGREHALAWGLARSPQASRLVCAPGNAGTYDLAESVAVDPTDGGQILSFCRREDIDLVVIGPEAPLVAGVADALRAENVLVFGPGAAGARLEGSKAHAKDLMRRANIPTAKSSTVRSVAEAVKALEYTGERVAVKADGLAAGKGVVMAENRDEALEAVRQAVEEHRFGAAGDTLVLEEWLDGEEASVIALVDGENVRPLVPSQDHKRALDGDRGPNTGGMGAYAPYAPLAGSALDSIVDTCLQPLAAELARSGASFRGVLYAGLMLGGDGPKVLEYNVRFGDPETQVIVPLFDGDLLETFRACARGELDTVDFGVRSGAALTVVAASGGYPGRCETGKPISGLEAVSGRPDTLVFHAGTARTEDDEVVTAGGRVLTVTGFGEDFPAARAAAYDALSEIRFDGMFFRTDIGARAVLTAKEETA